MSYCLDLLLQAAGDAERLADIARNDALAGFTPVPPVDMDDVFFARNMALPVFQSLDAA